MRLALQAAAAPMLLGACSPYLCRDRGECQAGDPLCVLCDVESFPEDDAEPPPDVGMLDVPPEPQPSGHSEICDRVVELVGPMLHEGQVPACDWISPFGLPPWSSGEGHADTVAEVMRGEEPRFDLVLEAAEAPTWSGRRLELEGHRCAVDSLVRFDPREVPMTDVIEPAAYVRQSAEAAQAQPQTQDATLVFWFGESTDHHAIPEPRIHFGSVQMVTTGLASADVHGVRVYMALFLTSMDITASHPDTAGIPAQVWWPFHAVNKHGRMFLDLRTSESPYLPGPAAEVCSRHRDVTVRPTDETHCQTMQFAGNEPELCTESIAVVAGGVMGVSIL